MQKIENLFNRVKQLNETAELLMKNKAEYIVFPKELWTGIWTFSEDTALARVNNCSHYFNALTMKALNVRRLEHELHKELKEQAKLDTIVEGALKQKNLSKPLQELLIDAIEKVEFRMLHHSYAFFNFLKYEDLDISIKPRLLKLANDLFKSERQKYCGILAKLLLGDSWTDGEIASFHLFMGKENPSKASFYAFKILAQDYLSITAQKIVVNAVNVCLQTDFGSKNKDMVKDLEECLKEFKIRHGIFDFFAIVEPKFEVQHRDIIDLWYS